jgi:uncharacterized protein YutE (UPF0331/DUF86 family)
MSNEKILLQLITQLEEYIDRLKELQKYSWQKFKNDWQVEYSISRGLQLVIECSIDLGKEIITGNKFKKPRFYKEVFIILRQQKVISYELSEEMERLVEFRNRLVHEYLYLDPKEIYNILKNDLKYFEGFLEEIGKYIKSY